MMAPSTSPPPKPDNDGPLVPESKTGFFDDYEIGVDLGSGSFSVVKSATDRTSGQVVAVKCIKRSSLPPDEQDALRDEVSILRELKHPNIICMYDFYEEEEFYYLVMEVMEGGELFDRIVQKSYYNEKEARGEFGCSVCVRHIACCVLNFRLLILYFFRCRAY